MHETEMRLRAFSDEMDKVALPWKALKAGLQRAGGGSGAGMGLGAGVGGLGGAAVGGVKGYQEAREQGADVGGALASGLAGGVETGLKGAVYGAGAGAVGGGALGAAKKVMTPERVAQLSQMGGGVGALARTGQRQVHGLTGWTPSMAMKGKDAVGVGAKEGIRSIKGGAYTAAEAADAAKKLEGRVAQGGAIGEGVLSLPGKAYRRGKALVRGRGKNYKEELGKVRSETAAAGVAARDKGVAAAEKAERMGLTNIPGYAKSLVRKRPTGPKGELEGGLIDTIRSGVGEQWHGGGLGTKAMMAGFPAYSLGEAALGDTEPGGPGRGERMGSALGSLAYSMGPLPMGAQMLLGEAAGSVARRGGALLDKGKAVPTAGYESSGRAGAPMVRAPGREQAIRGTVVHAGKQLGKEVGL